MQKLIIYLSTEDLNLASWVLINEYQQIQQSASKMPLNTLCVSDDETDIIVIVPGEEVILTEVTLPALSGKKLYQALPYALEDQLLTDSHALHFATGPYQDTHRLPIAIVAQEKMRHWLTTLATYHLTPTCLIPTPFLLPFAENTWHLWQQGNMTTVRCGRFSGFSVDSNNLTRLLSSAPENTTLVNIEGGEEKWLPLATQLPITTPATTIKMVRYPLQLSLHKTIYLPLPHLIHSNKNAESRYINLLQAAFAPKRKSRNAKKRWRFVAHLILAAISITILGDAISWALLHHQQYRLQSTITAIYQQRFTTKATPNTTVIKKKMQEQLTSLTTQVNKNQLLLMLAKVSKPLTEPTGIHLVAMDYRNNQLTLTLSTNSFDRLDTFINALHTLGLHAKEQTAAIATMQDRQTAPARVTLIITEETL